MKTYTLRSFLLQSIELFEWSANWSTDFSALYLKGRCWKVSTHVWTSAQRNAFLHHEHCSVPNMANSINVTFSLEHHITEMLFAKVITMILIQNIVRNLPNPSISMYILRQSLAFIKTFNLDVYFLTIQFFYILK